MPIVWTHAPCAVYIRRQLDMCIIIIIIVVVIIVIIIILIYLLILLLVLISVQIYWKFVVIAGVCIKLVS